MVRSFCFWDCQEADTSRKGPATLSGRLGATRLIAPEFASDTDVYFGNAVNWELENVSLLIVVVSV